MDLFSCVALCSGMCPVGILKIDKMDGYCGTKIKSNECTYNICITFCQSLLVLPLHDNEKGDHVDCLTHTHRLMHAFL